MSTKKNLSELEAKIDEFLDYLGVEKGSSPLTIRNYSHYLGRFVNWLDSKKIKPVLASISPQNIHDYRIYLSKISTASRGELSRKTQGYHVIALRSFLKWLTKRGFEVMQSDQLDLPKIKDRQVAFLTGEQVDRLLGAPLISSVVGKRDKAILETLFSTGLRVSELVKLDRDKIDFTRRECGIVGKGGRARVVFLSSRAAEWINQYLDARADNYNPLFIRRKGKIAPSMAGEELRLSPRSVQRLVKKYAKKIKLPVEVTPHVLRHCIGPNTRIFLENSIESARNIYYRVNENGAYGLDLNKFILVKSNVIGKEYHIDKAYSVWADGYELVCSKGHRVFTLGLSGIEEVQVKDLEIGQYILGVNKV